MDLLQPVRGTADLLPEDKARHNYVVSVAQDVARRSGFQDMATPVFEFTQVFSRPLGLHPMLLQRKLTALRTGAAPD